MISVRRLVPFFFFLFEISFAPGQIVPSIAPANPVSSSQFNVLPTPQTTDDDKKPDHDTPDNDKPVKSELVHHPILWQDPGNIAERDLYYGQGGRNHQPKPPFTFLSEDLHGTNPKVDARDAEGKKWRVKVGAEARPEVVASRLLWAVGYFANDDYLLPQATVKGIKMRRKSDAINGDHITDARFSRKPGGQDKIGTWAWKRNPFTGTRELNGLRVMMAVMNNWDLKTMNNAVYQDDKNGRRIFLASDIGATFGTNNLSWSIAHSKGNIHNFKKSKFITHETEKEVDFATPGPPTPLLIETGGATLIQFVLRSRMDSICKNVPREDVRWIASLLAQLSHKQLVDAFRAGHFPPDVIDEFVAIIESRIAELKAL